MKTTDMVFKPGADYSFHRQDTGGVVCIVRDGFADPWWLRFTITPDGKKAAMSVYQLREGFLCAVSERSLLADGEGWKEVGRQDYIGEDARYLPALITEGQRNRTMSKGEYVWSDHLGNRATGHWTYDVECFLLLGRLTVFEKYREWSGNGTPTEFNRTEIFEAANGFLGFDDELVNGWNGVVCRKAA